MSTLASVRIESWGGKFVVVGEFGRMTTIPRHEYDTYGEALREMSKILMREVMRYELNTGRNIDRNFDGD